MTKGMAALAALLLVGACGKKDAGDNCARMVDKSLPIFKKMMADAGKDFGDKEKTQLLTACREAEKAGKGKEDMKCVLDAKDEAAVAACYGAAFGDYQTKAKKTEAQLQLNKLGKILKVMYIETSAFPVGKAALPEKDCCSQPNGKCANPAEQWASDPIWSALDFTIDEPGLFRYSYEGIGGQSFIAKAVGDLDCDGTSITYTLVGRVDNGNPVVDLEEPPPNSD